MSELIPLSGTHRSELEARRTLDVGRWKRGGDYYRGGLRRFLDTQSSSVPSGGVGGGRWWKNCSHDSFHARRAMPNGWSFVHLLYMPYPCWRAHVSAISITVGGRVSLPLVMV